MRIDYVKLAQIAIDQNSRNTQAKDTSNVLTSYLYLLSNLIYAGNSLTESEMAMIISSLDKWIKNKTKIITRSYSVGTIVQLDWGANYSPELSYRHPAVIVEEWSTMVLVVPTTSNSRDVASAYHPIDNPSGNWFYRKVGTTEGFAHDCALILNNAKVVSKSRIQSAVGSIAGDISKPENVFREIRRTIMQNYFTKEWIEYQKLQQAYYEEVKKNIKLQEQYDNLAKEYEKLKEQNKNSPAGPQSH